MKSNLQIILLIVFILALVVGVLIFSGIIPVGTSTSTGATGNVVLWGTIEKDLVVTTIDNLNSTNKNYTIVYVEKDPNNFDTELTNALARGEGPDLFFLPDNLILKHSNKAVTIPFVTYPEKTFRDTYISEAEIYLNPEGIVALPVTIDPLVMYYNKDILEGAGVVNPPAYWEDFGSLVKSVTTIGPSRNIIQSAVAFGEFSNVNHAKDILATFYIQTGNPIVTQVNAELRSRLSDTFGTATNQDSNIFGFYSDFSNSIKDNYSWNRSLPNSLNAFIAGDLAVYLGYASELPSIQEKNPNLNFDVVKIPQTKGSSIKATFGRINAIALSKASKNPSAAYLVMGQLAGTGLVGQISTALNLPPVRRDLLAVKPITPFYMTVFYDSALIARAWLDPSPKDTDLIFKTIIEDISSGRLPVNDAVNKGSAQLDQLLQTQ